MVTYRRAQESVRLRPEKDLGVKTRPEYRKGSGFAGSPKAYRVGEAARVIGVSEDWFREKVLPELRVVREGRMKIIPVIELDRWLDKNATRI